MGRRRPLERAACHAGKRPRRLRGLCIAKYVALREAGVAEGDQRLIIVHDLKSGDDHAVVAAHVEGKWFMLDNRHMVLTEDSTPAPVVPLFAVDTTGVRQFTTSVADAHRLPAPAQIAAVPSAIKR